MRFHNSSRRLKACAGTVDLQVPLSWNLGCDLLAAGVLLASAPLMLGLLPVVALLASLSKSQRAQPSAAEGANVL